MKASSIFALVFGASLALIPRPAAAQDDDTLSHFSVSAIGQYLDYAETVSGSTADSDKGSMWGAAAEWRQDITSTWMLLAKLSYATTNSAIYDGALQYSDGTTEPYSTDDQGESIFLFQADVGYKLYRSPVLTVSPLVGLGFRDWVRGQDDLSTGDYQEDYSWFFIDTGVDLDLKDGDWQVGFLGKIAYPLSPVMQTDVAGDSLGTLSFDLGAVLSYIASATIEYHFPSSDRSRSFYLSLKPFFEHWGIGKSNTIYYASQYFYPGYYVGMYEPNSTTNIFGVSLGVGMDASLF